jgi:hypothetical protein
LFDEAATDKRLMPHLDEAGLGPIGRISVREDPGRGPNFQQVYRFERVGEALPFFQRYDVAMVATYQQEKFALIDPRTGQEAWPAKELTRTHFLGLTQANGPPNAPRFPYRTLGHLVVLPVGHMVFGIDPIGQQVIWEKNLAPSGGQIQPGGQPWQSPTTDRDGSLLLLYPDGFAQRIGQAGSLEGSILCVQTREGLEGIDPLTGKTLWLRTDVASRAVLFADAQHVFVVETNTEGAPTATRVLRAADGFHVKAPPFAHLFARRLRTFGRNLLLSETAAGGAVTLRLYDVLEGKDLWSQTFPARSLVLHSEEPTLTGVVEADGKVHVLDAHTGKVVLQTEKGYDFTNPRTGMDPAHLANLQSLGLVADADRIYLACNGTLDMNVARFGPHPLQSNLTANQGLRALPVNGMIYAYDRASGEFKWNLAAPYQTITLERFSEVPVMLLTSRHTRMINAPGGRAFANAQQSVAFMSVDKRTGKTLWAYKEETPNPFHTLLVDPRAGKIELISMTKCITHQLNVETASGKVSGGPALPPGPGVKEAPRVEIKR